ncbi:MAG: GNAT family N-acetyltransferase [Nanoarchaeota archaeon]|nr:GNAT family N-acetyltransferase [Nanoarchaeota archaeon]
MKIRDATKRDIKEIVGIFLVETNKKPYLQGWNEKTALAKIKGLFKDEEVYVALINDKIVGFVTIKLKKKKNEIYVDEFWLRKNHQEKGIGTEIMKFIENRYKKKGFGIMAVTAHQKARALNFYKKMRFKEKHLYVYLTKRIK